jgi:hypothetical protein
MGGNTGRGATVDGHHDASNQARVVREKECDDCGDLFWSPLAADRKIGADALDVVGVGKDCMLGVGNP